MTSTKFFIQARNPHVTEIFPPSFSFKNNVTGFFTPGATQPIVGVYFTALYRALASSRTRLLDHTQRRATVGRTALNE